MNDSFSSILMGAGGLSLFLYGMVLLSEGLKTAAGPFFRHSLSGIASHRVRGYLLGTLMGATVHSSASTVLVVGLLNAGLLTLIGAIPIIAGANFGTSLAMQFIAFDMGWLWSAFAIAGLLLRLVPGSVPRHRIGQALIGLSLLFLGMKLMSQSVFPFRALLSDWMAGHHEGSWSAFAIALGGSLLFTMIVQSSGATIGMLFSLSAAGVFTDIEQIIPYLIGAQIGTCITAIISSMGTSADARRGALGHLYFNLITAGLSIALLPWLTEVVRWMDGSSLTRQIAHAHTVMLFGGGVVIVPFSRWFVALLHTTARFAHRESDRSMLDETLLAFPPEAILAAQRELVRASRIVRRGFALNRTLAAKPNHATHRLVKQTEETMDLIYEAMRDYLMRLAGGISDVHLGARIQWLNLSLIFFERISDHNDNLADLSMQMNHRLSGEDRTFAHFLCEELYRAVEPLLAELESAWSPNVPGDVIAKAKALREHRARYLPESEHLQGELVARIAAGTLKPITGFVLTEYISEMDRIVRHTKKIAGILEKAGPPP
jgi:phosphate:Na+ symporter